MEIHSLCIEEIKTIKQFYQDITTDLRNKEVYQWDRFYPNGFIIKGDLKKGNLFGIYEGNHLAGAIVLDNNQSKKYKTLEWKDQKGTPLVIHRLAVHPNHQGKGYGKKLLQFAENYAERNGYTSIRFDVYSENHTALTMYARAGYQSRGIVRFPFRTVPYECFEKMISKHQG